MAKKCPIGDTPDDFYLKDSFPKAKTFVMATELQIYF